MSDLRIVVSRSKKRKATRSGIYHFTQMVINKVPNGKKKNGKPAFFSYTSHEIVY
jgi:hypothetical protein